MRRRRRRHIDSGPLRLDRAHKKIGGVCAGIANYFACSSFTIRVLALIALVMMPHITLPAYGLAYLILDDETNDELYDL